ncbi:hypothetical protein [Streptacidiphilus cavernicola]|uniref:Uncharacterized protein n=1 Tax=Streptacidiphilus cavernicola TaxID=3342716 RepID=A0ABV6VNU7_9ACTN
MIDLSKRQRAWFVINVVDHPDKAQVQAAPDDDTETLLAYLDLMFDQRDFLMVGGTTAAAALTRARTQASAIRAERGW